MVVHHEVAGDIGSWRLFQSRDLYIVGSIAVDQYLIVPKEKLEITMDAIKLLDGTSSLEAIQRSFRAKWGKNVDFVSIFLKLREAGLVKTAQLGSRPASEILRNSIRLLNLHLSGITQLLASTSWAFAPLFLIPTTVLLAIMLATFNFTALATLSGLAMNSKSIGQYVGIWVGLLLTAVIHELSHGVAASRFGLKPRSLTIALYLGFVPYIYIRIPGIYTLSAGKRMVIWGAGMYSNLVMIGILWQMLLHVPAHTTLAFILGSLIWANIGLITFNLSPFMATDGYFMLSTALRTPNIRTKAYVEGRKWLKRESNQFGLPLALYAIASVILVSWLAEHMIVVLSVTLIQIWHGQSPLASAVDLWPYVLMIVLMIVSTVAQRVWQRKTLEGKPSPLPIYEGEELGA